MRTAARRGGITFLFPVDDPAGLATSVAPSDLTRTGQFDSYLTMYAERGGPGLLAPGQFERIAKALADPRRFSLLKTIAEAPQECAYQKLCSVFPVSKATISHHMKELATAGLVETERDGQYMHARLVPGVIEAYTAELQRRIGGSA